MARTVLRGGRRRSVLGLVVLAALLVLVACNDDDDAPSAVEGTQTAAPPASESATAESATMATALPTTTEAAVASPSPTATASATPRATPELTAYPVPAGSRPHDVAPAADGGVWYTAQGSGELGWLDPETGQTRHVALGAGSAPHGVIVGPDGAPWVTDGGLNAIVRLDPASGAIEVFSLPPDRPGANLNTATFDAAGVLWFTGQAGVYGRLDPASGQVEVFDAPRGRGPYGIVTAPGGEGLLRLAGRELPRAHRRRRFRRRCRPRAGAADRRSGCAARLGGLARPDLGQRVERRTGQQLRPCLRGVAELAAARRGTAGLRRLRRRDGPRLAERLRSEHDCAFRPADRAVRVVRAAEQPGQRAAAAGASRRGLGRGVSGGSARGDPLLSCVAGLGC